MVIVVCCLKYEYGYPERGFSFEYYNFLDTLRKMDEGKNKIIHFAFDEIYQKYGRTRMNTQLVEVVRQHSPDLVFFFLYNDEFSKDVLLYLKNELRVTTFNWFADDHWRFYNFSRHWAPYFTFVSTTDSEAISKYHKFGINNVIKTQWGFNHYLYKKPEDFDLSGEIKYKFDVTFVGQKHSNRASLIKYLTNRNVPVDCWGKGWANGRLPFERMLEVFRLSKINLNFSNASGGLSLRSLASVFITRRIDHRLRLQPIRMFPDNILSTFHRIFGKQIKGRVFEIVGSGGFLLTQNADNLGEYFVDGKEIAVFNNKQELLKKINFFLKNEELRKEITLNGYLRALKEHTYEARFKELFKKMNLIKV
ncbi:MAG: glycosyltransferase [Candidatus Kapaibacteriota bacterium]